MQGKLKQFSMRYLFRKDKTVYYLAKVLMVNRITRNMLFLQPGKIKNSKNPTTFQVMQSLRGFCLTCLTLNLIVHIKAMWFVTFSTKHLICKTSLRLNRCLIKVKTKLLQVCLCQFCIHSQLLLIALYFQVITTNPLQLQLHSLEYLHSMFSPKHDHGSQEKRLK